MDNPKEKYYLREAARILKISPMTLKRGLDFLLKEGLIIRNEEKNNIFYRANDENVVFKHNEICYNLWFLNKNRLVEKILEFLPATSIALYGSYAKGENTKVSDVDILVISQKKDNPCLEIAKTIKREVNIKIFTMTGWAKQAENNKAYYMDLITEGIVLYGRRPIIE